MAETDTTNTMKTILNSTPGLSILLTGLMLGPLSAVAANKNVWISEPVDTAEGVRDFAMCGFGTIYFTAQTSWPSGNTWNWSGAALQSGAGDTPSTAAQNYTSAGTYYVTATYNGEVSYAARVTIINLVMSDQLWYFNGHSPQNYNVSITITAQGATTGTFQWDIIQGSGKALFAGNLISVTRTDNNTVALFSTGGSTSLNDLWISFNWNSLCSDTLKTQVYTPGSLSYLGCQDAANPILAYESSIGYAILDQFGSVLPHEVEINEYFTTYIVSDYWNTDWRRGKQGWFMANPQGFADSIAG